MEQNLDYVIDTGKGTYLFINQNKGVDLSDNVYKRLGIVYQPENTITEGEQTVINNDNNKR
jgi:hypothetical protein